MTIASCPKCADQVTMPTGVGREATVRCPLCQEEFQLAEVLDKLPPMLVVVAPGPAAQTALPVAAALDYEADADVAVDEEEPRARPEFAVTRGPTVVTRETPPSRRRGRPPRKPKNALVEGIKIILGGLCGLAIGQIVLWWLPMQEYRRDPLKLGPKVAKHAAWIVPEKFRGTTNKPTDAVGSVADRGTQEAAAKQVGDDGSGKDDGLPKWRVLGQTSEPTNSKAEGAATKKTKTASKPQKASRKKHAEDPDETLDRENMPDLSGNLTDIPELKPGDLKVDLLALPPTPDLPPVELPAVGKPAKKTAKTTDTDDTPTVKTEPDEKPSMKMDSDEKPPTAPEPQPPKSARRLAIPAASSEAVKQALAAAETATKAWTDAEKPEAQASDSAYEALTRLGETLAFAAAVDPATAEAASNLLGALAQKPEVLRSVAQAGPKWLKAESPKTRGVLLVAVVQKIEQRGELFETTLKLAGGDPGVLVSARDPADAYQPNARILVLGGLVDDPAQNIAGFEGSPQRVVWTGCSRVLP